ncbi:MAG: gluconate 2-dehydrogenase subunit 3 family protein [Verrucomicrobiota bacterium]
MNPLHSPDSLLAPVDRRRAMQWMLAAVAATTAIAKLPANAGITEYKPTLHGYGTDPVLAKNYVPGDFWPLSFTESQRSSAASICDILFPADGISPSASSLHVHDFIDEWISAPYEAQAADRQPILDCIAWFEAEAEKRFKAPLTKLTQEQRNSICDDVAFGAKSKAFQKAASDFGRFKYVAAGGFYTTPEGMKDVGYVGNTPSATFEGPTLEALKHVGLA